MPTSTQQHTLRFDVDSHGIATLWLDSGEHSVVILNRDLIQRFNTTLDAIEQHTNIQGLILRSDCERVFVAGADLAEIDGLDDQELHAYLAFGTTVFARLASLPFQTVAAIDGASLGGGLEIAMHCDALLFSKTNLKGKAYPVGLPEAGLGLCPGWGGTQLLPARVRPELGITSAATGATFMSSELPDGLAVSVVDTPDDLQHAAEAWIQEHIESEKRPLGMQQQDMDDWNEGLATAKQTVADTDAAQAVFYAVETGIAESWSAAIAVEQCELVRLRNTRATREKLEAFLSKDTSNNG